MIWKHSFLSNCVKTNSAGVIILYNKQYDLVHKYADHEGRQLIAVLGNDEMIIVVNAYFPNDHKQGVTFAEQMYTKVLEVQSEYPDHITFCARDMNVCLGVGGEGKSDYKDCLRSQKMLPMKKSTIKVQLMQMILVLSVKKALNAYNKSSMNMKDLQEDQGWNSMLTRLKF
jgi:exonuclease III